MVRLVDTDFNAQLNGNLHRPDFVLTELQTSWGTTVSVKGQGDESDPDAFEFEWVESVLPLRGETVATCVGEADESTAVASDDESSSSKCSLSPQVVRQHGTHQTYSAEMSEILKALPFSYFMNLTAMRYVNRWPGN